MGIGKKLGCVVMAAGSARRYGGNKLSARFQGKSLIARTLDAIPPEHFTRVVVVTQYPEIMDLAAEYHFMPVLNRRPEAGLSRTIALGLGELLDCGGVMFLVSDQPLLRRDSIAELARLWRAQPEKIAAAAHGGVRGNPCIFPSAYFGELLALEGDQGGGAVIRRHEDALTLLEVPAGELADVDTPEAMECLALGASNKAPSPMERSARQLKSCQLFGAMSEETIQTALLPQGKSRTFAKDGFIITPQERLDHFGVLIRGRARLLQCFSDGSHSLMGALPPLSVLGGELLFADSRRPCYYAVAAVETQVLFFPAELVLEPGRLPEGERAEVWRRLLTMISNENIRRQDRLTILSAKGLRDRILVYLSICSERLGTNTFQIPFSREELASFLCVNRSALSHELSLMEREGLIRFHKNNFTLLPKGMAQSIWKHIF